MGKLIFLHGCSGLAGKSTIGALLQQHLTNAAWIDQDVYYKKVKPCITINDKQVQNWDCDDAVDYTQFVHDIVQLQKTHDYVIVTGFALRRYLLHIQPDLGFLLECGLSSQVQIDKMIAARQQSKNINSLEKRERDKQMVSSVVYPYYQETLQYIDYDYIIPVWRYDGQRLSKDDIVVVILKLIYNK